MRNISMSQIDIFKTEWETNDNITLRRGVEKFSVVLKSSAWCWRDWREAFFYKKDKLVIVFFVGGLFLVVEGEINDFYWAKGN